jgi:transaldolase
MQAVYPRCCGLDQVLVAAISNDRQIAEAALAGADTATAGFEVLSSSFAHPFTDKGLKVFQSWDKIPQR